MRKSFAEAGRRPAPWCAAQRHGIKCSASACSGRRRGSPIAARGPRLYSKLGFACSPTAPSVSRQILYFNTSDYSCTIHACGGVELIDSFAGLDLASQTVLRTFSSAARIQPSRMRPRAVARSTPRACGVNSFLPNAPTSSDFLFKDLATIKNVRC